MVSVNLAERSYNVHVERGASKRVDRYLPEGAKPTAVFVITDDNVAPLYGGHAAGAFEAAGLPVFTEVIPAGESEKTLATVERLYHAMLAAPLDRKSLVVAVGGGVVGDIAGFAAATYMRGIPIVQVPTTIVAQVDSSLGGKTGVDMPEGKNLVGAFHQPLAVVTDPETLSTLPRREISAGLAEVVKHGVILDAAYFERLEALGEELLAVEPDTMHNVVLRSVEIKADVVSRDEREGGLRAILNFGHTVAHAVETLTGFTTYLHGEAVSIGMAAAANVAEVMGLCDGSVGERISALCEALALPLRAPNISAAEVIEAFGRDKKTVGGVPRFVLPREIGKVEIGVRVDEGALREGLVETGFSA
jgi:3-dehydroquinate synthase